MRRRIKLLKSNRSIDNSKKQLVTDNNEKSDIDLS